MTPRELVNQERHKHRLGPLRRSALLRQTARWKARRITRSGVFAHDASIHGARRFAWAGEVLAQGQTSPEQVVRAWLASPGHRAILLSPQARRVGFARRGRTWVGHFARP